MPAQFLELPIAEFGRLLGELSKRRRWRVDQISLHHTHCLPRADIARGLEALRRPAIVRAGAWRAVHRTQRKDAGDGR